MRIVTQLSIAAAIAVTLPLPTLAQPYAYVPNLTSDNVTIINTATDTLVTNLAVGDLPQGVSVRPDGEFAYIANRNGNTISVIDTETNTVATTISGFDGPVGMDFNPDGTRLYVANFNGDTISVVSTGGNSIIDTIPAGDLPWSIAMHQSGNFFYATIRLENRIGVFRTGLNTEIDSIPTGPLPLVVTMHPDGSKAYVTNVGDSTVSVIDTTTHTVIETVGLLGEPWGVTVNPDGQHWYVAEDAGNHRLFVFDTATNSLVASPALGLGFSPCGIAAHPDGSRVYVSGGISNTVQILDTGTNTFTGAVGAGANSCSVGEFVQELADPFTLEVSGDCPFEVDFEVTNATPLTPIQIFVGEDLGSNALAGPRCFGTELGIIDIDVQYITSSNGLGRARVINQSARCGHFVVAVDLKACKVTNIVQIPDP